MAPEKFVKWRQSLARELIAAYSHYHVWEQLWPTEKSIEVLNRFKVFFHYTIAAHQQLFFLHVAKATEERRDSINLWRLLDNVAKYPNLVPRLSKLETQQLLERLEGHRNLLSRIRTHRNKRIAHVDERHSWPDSHIWQDNVVTIGEARNLLQDLEDIFNKISAAHDGHRWILKTIGLEDTTTLLEALYDWHVSSRRKSANAMRVSRFKGPQ